MRCGHEVLKREPIISIEGSVYDGNSENDNDDGSEMI